MLRARHREPNRNGGHPSVARGPARSIFAENLGACAERGRADRDPRAHHGQARGRVRARCPARSYARAANAGVERWLWPSPCCVTQRGWSARARRISSGVRAGARTPGRALRGRRARRAALPCSKAKAVALLGGDAHVAASLTCSNIAVFQCCRHRILPRSLEGEADGVSPVDQIVRELLAAVAIASGSRRTRCKGVERCACPPRVLSFAGALAHAHVRALVRQAHARNRVEPGRDARAGPEHAFGGRLGVSCIYAWKIAAINRSSAGVAQQGHHAREPRRSRSAPCSALPTALSRAPFAVAAKSRGRLLLPSSAAWSRGMGDARRSWRWTLKATSSRAIA